ncbi:MAG: hypothetical protein CMJ18_25245 [Phycisphaeraceae bacterium]|nr:hypothetical protein [Phycisphaeraceae bacterium]
MVAALASSASAQFFSEDFSGGADGGLVSGVTSQTGQTWGAFTLFGSYSGLSVDDQYGLDGNGSGNLAAGSTAGTFFGNSVPLGQTFTSGSLTLDFEIYTLFSGTSGTMSVLWLHDSVNGGAISVNRQNNGPVGQDDLTIAAPGPGEQTFSTGITDSNATTMHYTFEVNLDTLNVDLSYFDVSDPNNGASSGTINIGTIDGPFQPDTIQIWGRSSTSNFQGWDNIVLTPEPASVVLLSAGALLALRRRR